jgi:hypothetical protein
VKKRGLGFKGFRGVGKPKREWDFGPPVERRPLRKLGYGHVFRRLTDRGKGMLLNLAGEKRQKVYSGPGGMMVSERLVPGTGAASRLTKPELLARLAAIRLTLDVKNVVHPL